LRNYFETLTPQALQSQFEPFPIEGSPQQLGRSGKLDNLRPPP
jgi:hypothetical protein